MAQDTDILVCNVGYSLKLIRLTQRLRLEDVASENGMHKHALRRLESGAQRFNIGTVVPLIKFYKKPVASIIKDYERKPTHSEWKELKLLQKEVNKYHKSKKRKNPNAGVQLELKL